MSDDYNLIGANLVNIENVKQHILPLYGLEEAEVSMVKFKDTDKQRAVFKVVSKTNNYCLKKVYYDEENLLFVYSAMEWLYRNSVLVPRLLPTIDNGRFVNFNNMLFILTPWVEGEKCNFDNINHLMLSSQTLSKLHKTTKKFTPIDGSTQRIGLDDYHLSISKHFNDILQSANLANNYKDKFSKIFLDNLNYNLELAKVSLEISSSINNATLNTSLCHGDYVNKNIIINNKDVWVIDFDKCKVDYCAHDIAYFLRRLLKRPTTNWSVELTMTILNNYLKTNTLSESDFKYILAYLAFPQKFWKISRDYYKNIKNCNKTSFILIFEKGLERTYQQLEYVNNMIEIFEKYYNVRF